MKKEDIMKNATSAFNKVSFKLKKHSPEILVVAGVVGVVASTVMACRATTKVGKIIDKTKGDVEEIHVATEKGITNAGETYSVDDSKKDLAVVYFQTGIKLAKLYAPSVALGTLSITGIVASHNILRKRNVALAAAYATVDKSFKEYRNRVIERFGAEVDKELRNNIKAKKFEEITTDSETGKEKKSKTTIDIANPMISDYKLFFDEKCKAWVDDYDYNLMTLRCQQQYANDKLRADGFLFMSDVYDMLGIQRTKISQTVGWIYDPSNPDIDSFVDFEILETNRETEDGGYEPAILLNFNVDGPILDLLPR